MRKPRTAAFGEVMHRRATGELPEMECARSLARVLSALYRPGMTVLDAGCGAGHYRRSLVQRVDPAIEYQGIDHDAHYIELARDASDAPDRFQVADLGNLPFPDAAFDIVFASNVIPNLPPPPTKALRELVRVAARHIVLRTLFAPCNYVIQEFTDPGDELDPGPPVYNNMYSEAYYRAMLRSIDTALAVEIQQDRDWHDFGEPDPGRPWRTRVVDGMQVAGQLILDWRFITITKES